MNEKMARPSPPQTGTLPRIPLRYRLRRQQGAAMHDLEEAFRTIGATFTELENTILLGWPTGQDWPTELEAGQIEATHHELLMHEPDLGEQRAWMIAGNIVGRFRRDLS